MYTVRQYAAVEKFRFIKAFPAAAKAAAELLGPDLAGLEFHLATVFRKSREVAGGVRIEFRTKKGELPVWVDVDVSEAGAKKVLDGRSWRRAEMV